MKWTYTKLTCLFVLAIALLNGCAFGTREVMLSYPPPVSESTLKSAHATTPAQANGKTIIIDTISDTRSVKHRIGNVRNGFGMDTADVIAKNDVREWVIDALDWELKHAGYTVKHSASKGEIGKSATILNGQVNHIYCDVYFNYDGKAAVILKATHNGKDLINNMYTGSGSAGANFAASAEAYGESLALALQDAVKKFIVDLNNKLLK